MPLISLTAAQRSTFLTHISPSDPSSSAASFTTRSISETEGEFRDVSSGMWEADGDEAAIHTHSVSPGETRTLRPEGTEECVHV